MHADPIIDADRYTEQIGQRQDAYEAALERATLEIRTGFAVWFAGGEIVVPCVVFNGGVRRVMYQIASEAVDEANGYEETIKAHSDLLQGKVTIDQYRDAIVNRYIRMQASDIAEEWAA